MRSFFRRLNEWRDQGGAFRPFRRLNVSRRLVYLTASLIGLPSIIWTMEVNSHSVFWQVAYGGLLVCLVIWSVALFHPRVSLRHIERFVLIVILAFTFSKHVYLLYFSDLDGASWIWEMQSVYWSLAIGFVIAYILFNRKVALVLCWGIVFLWLLVALPQLSSLEKGIWREFFRLEVRLAVMALVLLFLAQAKDDLVKTQARVSQAEMLADRDALTGLYNRRAAARLIQESLESGKAFSLIVVDIDHFKKINDTHGHGVGDRVLQDVASFLRNHLRGEDVVGRWGGEEFVILLFGEDVETHQQTAERLRSEIERTSMFGQLVVLLSLGGTMRLESDTLESLFERADGALYQAKRLGRNRTEWI